jgi:hypothetical protein
MHGMFHLAEAGEKLSEAEAKAYVEYLLINQHKLAD